ncbi:MAG TPA: Rz1-like lysis system protein LysC, partial [Kofleriaceae bacterium]|nr:Rz1-like lysis system protein LysC [Kofleriaceae bacterium]
MRPGATRALFLALAACSASPATPAPPAAGSDCARAATATADAERARADGDLYGALRAAEQAALLCRTPGRLLALADVLADIGMDERAAEAYRQAAVGADIAQAARARRGSAAIARRPPLATPDPAARD